jgi:hypothetical protein
VVLLGVPQTVTGTDADTDLGEGVDPTALEFVNFGESVPWLLMPDRPPKTLCVLRGFLGSFRGTWHKLWFFDSN